MNRPKLAIILLNWNDAERTIAMYEQIRLWELVVPYIIIVDNHSKKEELEKLSDGISNLTSSNPTSEGSVLLLKNKENGGFAGGNNLGIQAAIQRQIPYTLLLNTDAHISEESILQLLSRMDQEPKIGILGPSIKEGSSTNFKYLIGGRDIAHYSFTRISTDLDQLKDLPHYPLHFVDYVSGTIFLVRTKILEELKGLEESYFFSGEIADFCQLAKAKDYQIAVDVEAVGEHLTDKTNSKLRDTLYVYYSLRNRFLYIRRHYPQQKNRLFAYWILQGFRQMPGAIIQANFKKLRAMNLGLWDGCRGRFGNRNDLF
jgi:GT2 family glycosyltransferase